MAFPVPDRLSRKSLPTDVSSRILAKISDATSKSLTSKLAAEWDCELQLSIQQTKDQIYDRIHEELPDFERQLDSSRSVQTRLRDLSSYVDKLSETLGNSETGLLPTLHTSLRAHRELSQHASDAQVSHEALLYLSECRIQFETLSGLVGDGNLAEGVGLSATLSKALDEAPEAVLRADIMTDVKSQFRRLKDRMEEQLSDAYSRSIQISPTELRISPSVQVRQSQTTITLQDTLASLSAISLDSLLASLRRDIIAHFVDFPLQQATSSNISRAPDANGAPSICLSIFPLPPSPTFRNSIPVYLKTLFDFLRENLYLALPTSTATSFPQTFYKPTAAALLRNVLVPSLPSSLSDLSPFLLLVQDSVRFEREFFFRNDPSTDGLHDEGDVQAWARGVASHYGRKRRIDLLAGARRLVLSGADGRTVRVDTSQPPEDNVAAHAPEVIPVQGEIGGCDEPKNGWDFDDDAPTGDSGASKNSKLLAEEGKPSLEDIRVEESSWDFEEVDHGTPDQAKAEDVAEDDSDAWGWGDGEEDGTPAANGDLSGVKSVQSANGHEIDGLPNQDDSKDSTWGSAWDEPQPVPLPPPSPVQQIAPTKVPKVAKRLEKLSAKGKGKGKGLASPALSFDPPSSTFSASSAFPSSVSSSSYSFSSPRPDSSFSSATSPLRSIQLPLQTPQTVHSKPPAFLLPRKLREPETYLISGRAQDLIRLVSNILSEGASIASSSMLSDFPLSSPESSSNASTLVLQAAPAALDLYRAVYPVAYTTELTRSARALRFSNDCTYVHEEVAKLELPTGTADATHEQMREALKRLHALSVWWFDEGIERECERVLQILSRGEGFTDTGDQERFDECEDVMSEVLREVRTATGEWKTILPRTKWLQAAGCVVETSLARVLADVLALPDIPELDSRRLSELCRILNALEGLFVDADDPDAPSMVLAYVPSWLKYSYLSELLEASIADVSYLFDEGALIDFSVDELVRLVRALFADTPLRTNTVAKLQRGHPVAVD